MANFELAIPELLEVEGEYSDDKYDRGGKTKYGIIEKKARSFGYEGDMKDLPLDFAKDIYKKDYWDRMHLDDMKSQVLAGILFNYGVNCGTSTASKSLQRALNILNRNSISWFDTMIDGIIGNKTMGLVNELSESDTLFAAKIIIGLQFEKYISIVERDSTQEVFIRGWINRVNKLLKGLR